MLNFCTLASGSNGNCTFISDGETRILIDAGISTRMICTEFDGLGAQFSQVDAVLVTHEHTDHVEGLATMLRRFDVKLFVAEGTVEALLARVPEARDRITSFPTGAKLQIGDFEIDSFRTPHDTANSVGYKLRCQGKSVMIATDLGHVTEEIQNHMENLDLLLLEANYDENKLLYGRYPQMLKRRIASDHGHLSNSDCAECVSKAVARGTKRVLLGHLSAENNTPRLAYETVHARLTYSGVIPGVDMMLGVAPRGARGELYTIE